MQRLPAAAGAGSQAADVGLMGAPVRYTCSDINDAQKNLRGASADLDQIDQLLDDEEIDVSQVRDYLRSARRDIESVCRNDLETLRDANDKLREWGTENEEALETLREEHAELVREHEEVEARAEEAGVLEEQLADLVALLWSHDLPPALAAALRAAGHGPAGEQLALLLPPPSTGSAHQNAAVDSAPPS